MKTIYSVMECDKIVGESDVENLTSEYFGENREGAISYLKSHLPFTKCSHKDWEFEEGLNYYEWKKDNKIHALYLKMLDVEEELLNKAMELRGEK